MRGVARGLHFMCDGGHAGRYSRVSADGVVRVEAFRHCIRVQHMHGQAPALEAAPGRRAALEGIVAGKLYTTRNQGVNIRRGDFGGCWLCGRRAAESAAVAGMQHSGSCSTLTRPAAARW